jgi:putative nucleotidyltransferase with HDIG domain
VTGHPHPSTLNTTFLSQVEKFVRNYYTDHHVSDRHYHTIEHTVRVADVCFALAQAMKLGDEEVELILIAAWFHDAGYCVSREKHERHSAEIARAFLVKQGFAENRIEFVESLILCTDRKLEPGSDAMRILRDAGLHYIGKPYFIELSKKLRVEWTELDRHSFTDKEWLDTNIRFFESHQWHTQFARDWYDELKIQNLAIVRAQIN